MPLTFSLDAFLRIRAGIKEVGENLYISIDDTGIVLEDIAGGQPIEKRYSWGDIKDITLHVFTSWELMYNQAIGMMFIVDNNTYFRAMTAKRRKALPPYEQRNIELSGAFFMMCDRELILGIMEMYKGKRHDLRIN